MELRYISALVLAVSFPSALTGQNQPRDTLSNAPAKVFVNRPPYEVVYDHLSGSLEVRNHNGRVQERWDRETSSAPLIRLPADRPVVIVIDNANALLYAYEVSAEVLTRKDVRACRDVGSQFSATALLSELRVLAGVAQPRGLAGQFASTILPEPEARGFGAEPTRGRLDPPTLERALREIRAPISKYIDFSLTIVALANTLQDSLLRIAELGESTPIDSLLAELQRSIEHLQPGLSISTQVPQLLRRRAEVTRPHLHTLAVMTRAIRVGEFDGDQSGPAATEALMLASRVDSVLPILEAAYRRLQAELVRIDIARARSRQTFTTGPSGDVRHLVLELRPTGDMEEIPRLRQGKIEIYTEPTVPVRCQISIGITWMDPPPEYAVEDTVLVNRAGSTRAAASLAFHVSLPSFPVVAAQLGIGLGSNSRPDFYLGASLRLLPPVLVNGGIVWQYSVHLPSGIQVGQTVSDPRFLKNLPFSYRARVFWGLSYAP